MAMENDLVRVFKREVGNYKMIRLYCNSSLSEQEYLEVTQYPDGDCVVYLNSEYNDEIILSKKQLKRLMEELK
ncbi:hypothetical protein FKHLMAOI_00038 [Enterococcus phage KEF1]